MESVPIALYSGDDLPDRTVVEVRRGDIGRRMTEDDLAVLRFSTIAANTTVKRADNISEGAIKFEGHLREISFDGAYVDDSGTQQQLEDVVLKGIKSMSVGQQEVIEGGNNTFLVELVAVHGPEMLRAQAALYISHYIGQSDRTELLVARSVDEWRPIIKTDIEYWKHLRKGTHLATLSPTRLQSQTKHLLEELLRYSQPIQHPIETVRRPVFTSWQNTTLVCNAFGITSSRPRRSVDEETIAQNNLRSPLFRSYTKTKDLSQRMQALSKFVERYLQPDLKDKNLLADLVEKYSSMNTKSQKLEIEWDEVAREWSARVPGSYTAKAVEEIYEDIQC